MSLGHGLVDHGGGGNIPIHHGPVTRNWRRARRTLCMGGYSGQDLPTVAQSQRGR
jgi:hypothetical protein